MFHGTMQCVTNGVVLAEGRALGRSNQQKPMDRFGVHFAQFGVDDFQFRRA